MVLPFGTRTPPGLTYAACLAAVVPLLVFARQIRDGDYAPGSAYAPRLEAVIGASWSGVRGGPFASVRKEGGYTLAPGLLNDLGMAAIADLWGRTTGTPITPARLAALNAALMAAALFGLVLAVPAQARPTLAVLFVAVPVAVREYRSPDSVTVHGALAALAVALAIAPHRRWPPASGLLLGGAVFVAHKIRSPYGVFAIGAMATSASLVLLRTRRYESLRVIAFAAIGLTALEVPWRIALDRRANDPRVIDRDILREHNVYVPLVSGIGWTENRWAIQPWDPKVVEFVAARTGTPPVGLATLEGERLSRVVYLDLWREAPGYLVELYLSRLPTALRQYVWLGHAGAALWMVAAIAALRSAWRRRDAAALATVTAPVVVAAGLVAQIVLIDPRLLYSYPLRFVSAFGLLTAAALVLTDRLGGEGPAEGEPRQERVRTREDVDPS